MIWEPGASRGLTDEQKQQWDARIQRAEAKRKLYEPQWERGLKDYGLAIAPVASNDVNPLLNHRHVETKKAQLFYQAPEVQLHPIDPQNPEFPIDQILPLRQKVLNDKLGPDSGTDVKATVDEALFEALATSGFLPTEIGFDVRTAPTQPDPLTGELPVGANGQPVTEVPIWGQAFWVAVGSKKLLIPDDFRSTRFDTAPWLGLKLTMPLSRAKKEFTLPPDFSGTADRDPAVFEHNDQPGKSDPMVEYTKIWYRAELFDDTIVNPELFRLLVIVKGLDTPAKHVDSPFQAVDPMGSLTTDSMRGNPIHVGTLRVLSDSAYIRSDLVVGEQLEKEVTKFRTSLIRNRIARTPFNLIDPDGFTPDEIEKIKNGEKNVFTKPGELTSGRGAPIQSVSPGQEPRDNFAAQEYAERDWQGALGTADNQTGQVSQKKTTATEARIVQTNSGARAEAEKDRLREWFVAGVRKFDAVLQRTMTQQDLTLILGQQGAALWNQWRTMSGCYVYKILPDSGVHVDAAQFRAQKLDEYNLLRKDPLINAPELLKPIARALGYDPAKTILPQQPEQGPEPIKTSFAFKGEDLIGPQSQAVVEILAQMGISVSPQAIATLQQAGMMVQAGIIGKDGLPVPPPEVPGGEAKHGGSANATEPINKHSSERTGGVNGMPH